MHEGKKYIADAGEQGGGEHERLRTIAVEQVTDDGRGERALGACQRKR